MAKRELSSTLKNLKFMQRGAQKDEKARIEEEVIPAAGDFPASTVVKKCVVIAEGDPHPGAKRGRMSFLSFNPSIDKLNQEPSSLSDSESAASSSGRQNETISIRENGSSKYRLSNLEVDDTNGDLKCKPDEAGAEAEYPNKSRKIDENNQDSSPSRSRSSQKKNKREKLDWSVLRPPKYQNKRS